MGWLEPIFCLAFSVSFSMIASLQSESTIVAKATAAFLFSSFEAFAFYSYHHES